MTYPQAPSMLSAPSVSPMQHPRDRRQVDRTPVGRVRVGVSMRALAVALLLGAVSVVGPQAYGQTARGVTVRFAGRSVDDWISQAMADTSAARRDRIVAALRRAPLSVREAAASRLTTA